MNVLTLGYKLGRLLDNRFGDPTREVRAITPHGTYLFEITEVETEGTGPVLLRLREVQQ